MEIFDKIKQKAAAGRFSIWGIFSVVYPALVWLKVKLNSISISLSAKDGF